MCEQATLCWDMHFCHYTCATLVRQAVMDMHTMAPEGVIPHVPEFVLEGLPSSTNIHTHTFNTLTDNYTSQHNLHKNNKLL